MPRFIPLLEAIAARLAARPRVLVWVAGALALGLAAWEASYWPRFGFPGATWHNEDPGIDVTACRAGAARAGWSEMLGFWRGPYIDGNPTFRPLSAWLFVAQQRLFGADDAAWCGVSIALHLLAMAALYWAAGRLIGGGPVRRAAAGLLSVGLAAGPLFADRYVHKWVLAWWPSQPDPLSLACGLVLLAAAAEHVRARAAGAPGTGWAVLAGSAFLLGLCFKETTYAAGLGGCLLCLRERRAWPLLGALAGLGLGAYLYRSALYPGSPGHSAEEFRRLTRAAQVYLFGVREGAVSALPHFACLALGAAVAAVWRRRGRGVGEALGLGAVAWFFPLLVVVGPPTDKLFQQGWSHFAYFAGAALLLVGLTRAARRWPGPELILVGLLVLVLGWSFPPLLAWHRYWWVAFSALLTTLALLSLTERLPARAPVLVDTD